MRGTLRRLRNFRGIFSHYLVHDGIFVDHAVDGNIVREAFNDEAALLRLARVRIVPKPWGAAKDEYHRLLARYNYSHEVNIAVPVTRDGCTARSVGLSAMKSVSTGRRRPREMRGKVPKL